MTITMTAEPTFLYPVSRQYPFDEVCEQIVRELEKRNWRVPGMTVEFFENGHGDEKYRYLQTIKGEDFKLRFGRPQGYFGLHQKWFNSAAINDLIIPFWDLRVYDDESMSFTVYNSANWQSDKQRFMDEYKSSIAPDEPRWYRTYRKGCDCRGDERMHHWHEGRVPFLREENASDDESQVYLTASVFDTFTQWLTDNVLSRIVAEPETNERTDYFAREMVPFPTSIGPLFRFAESDAARRLSVGQNDPQQLEPGDRYGFIGTSDYVTVTEDGTVSDSGYKTYGWYGIGEITDQTNARDLKIPGHYRWEERERFIVRVTPKWANGVYVADNGAYERDREELFAAIKPRDRLTDAELHQAEKAREATIIPITEYDGSYEQPIILISRELGLDEVELVSGPWPECNYVRVLRDHDEDASSALDLAVSTQLAVRANYRDETARQQNTIAIEILAEYIESSEALQAAATVTSPRWGTHREQVLPWKLVEAAITMQELGLS